MVTLYVEGRPVGTLADAERLIPEFVAKNLRVEFRDAGGTPIGTFTPAAPLPVEEPDWVKEITPEETARRMAGPFLTFEEIQKQWGAG